MFGGYSGITNPFGSSMYGGYDQYGRPTGSAIDYGGNSMPDFRYRESAFAGNSSFTPPGGVRTGNPIGDMAVQMTLQSIFPGQTFRPFTAYDGAPIDYLRGQGRMQQVFKEYHDQGAQNGIFPADSQIGQNPVAQMATENLKYGGSSLAAFQSAYGRFGNIFSDSPEQGMRDIKLLMQGLDKQYSTDGKYDYDKSFGFKRQETIENLDSSLRFGVGGMSRSQFARDVREGRGGEYSSKVNEMMGMGKSTLGNDQSADQINSLLDKATGGIANVSPEKATEFLAKVQSTARALDINAKAFAEYVAAQQETYKAMGLGGQISGAIITNATLDARGASERGRQSGDPVLADQNKAQAAMEANAQASQGSTFQKQMRFMASQAETMNPEERARFGVDGRGVDDNLRAIDEMNRAGDVKGAQTLMSRVKSRFGADIVNEGGDHLTKEQSDRSMNILPDVSSMGADVRTRNEGTRLIYDRAKARPGFDSNAISLSTYQKAVANLGSEDIQNPAEIEKALRAQGVNESAIASSRADLSIEAGAILNNSGRFAGLGRNQKEGQVAASFDVTTPTAIEDNKKRSAGVSVNAIRAENLNTVMRSITRGVDVPEEVGKAFATAGEEAEKGGKIDFDRLKKIGTQYLKDSTFTDKLSKVQKDLDSGAMDVKGYKYSDAPGNTSRSPKATMGRDAISDTPSATPADKNSSEEKAKGSSASNNMEGNVPKEQLTVAQKSATTLDQMNEKLGTLIKIIPSGLSMAPNTTGIS